MVLFLLRSLTPLATQSQQRYVIKEASLKNDSPCSKEHISAIPPHIGKKMMPTPPMPTSLHTELWRLRHCKSISCATKTILSQGLWPRAILGSPAASRALPATKPHTTWISAHIGPCPMKGPGFFTAALLAVPAKRIYAEREGTGTPSTIGPIVSGCHIQLNVDFVISQLHRKREVRPALRPEMLSFLYSPQAKTPVGDHCFPAFFLFLRKTHTR